MGRANNKQDNFEEEQSWEDLILPDIQTCYKVIKTGIGEINKLEENRLRSPETDLHMYEHI